MSFLKQHKLAIILVILIIVAFAWYVSSGGGGTNGSATLTQQQDSEGEGAVMERELLSTILELRAIRLEGSIFDDPAFQSLTDFSTDIVAEPIGRPNPFAPLENQSTPEF